MPRGPLSEETKKNRLLEQAAALLGTTVEEFAPMATPLEIEDDFMREAQSALNYFESRGAGFKTKTCKSCEEPFSYRWDVDSIGYCSIECAKKSLEKIGLTWNPHKPPLERWGKTVPMVVSSSAKKHLDEVIESQDVPQEPPPDDTNQ